MTTAFDLAIEKIRKNGYHNHRQETHSDAVSEGVLADLLKFCHSLQNDLELGEVKVWYNFRSPGDRERKVDLFIGEPTEAGDPDITKVRVVLENKSVITAHRNKTNRFDDLTKTLHAIHRSRSEAVLVATVLIGLARDVLNVPDKVHPLFRGKEEMFQHAVLPRLSSGDASLWTEFDYAISRNRPNDPEKTLAMFQRLPTRNPAQTHVAGYDYVMLVPVMIDNVNSPILPRPNALRIDVDREYDRMLKQICRAYTARWHPDRIGTADQEIR